MDITLDGKYRNKIDYIFVAKDGKALQSQKTLDLELTMAFVAKDGKALQSQKTLDLELTMAQFMNSHCQIQTEIEGSRESHQTIQI